MLRQLHLEKPSTSMDARVMARPTLKIWNYVGVGSALAAAAALIIVVLVHGTAGEPVKVAATPNLEKVSVVPVVNVIEDKIIPGKDNQPPMHWITQETFEKTVWVDKTNNIHIERTGAPHREIIMIQAEVK